MPKKHEMSVTDMMQACILVDSGKFSIRETAKIIHIPKSTLYDHFDQGREELKKYENFLMSFEREMA